MTITAQVVADSINEWGNRLTTFQLRYPRFIHSEFMTHRTFSRNASSSRAIPVERVIADLRRDPAMPVYWGAHRAGMQAGAELTGAALEHAKYCWLQAMNGAIDWAEGMRSVGLHKQIANRILEPWAHINVVVTATEYDNFFELRRHSDAQPEIKVLADAMWDARQASTPTLLQPGEWHLPYVRAEDWVEIRAQLVRDNPGMANVSLQVTSADVGKALPVSVARCARVSYLTHDGRETTVKEDVALYEKLVVSVPLHASPAEHQATPDEWLPNFHITDGRWDHPELHGNFKGWCQFRRMLSGGIA